MVYNRSNPVCPSGIYARPVWPGAATISSRTPFSWPPLPPGPPEDLGNLVAAPVLGSYQRGVAVTTLRLQVGRGPD